MGTQVWPPEEITCEQRSESCGHVSWTENSTHQPAPWLSKDEPSSLIAPPLPGAQQEE